VRQLVGSARNLIYTVVDGDTGRDHPRDVEAAAEIVLMAGENEWVVDRKGKTLTRKPKVDTFKFLVTRKSLDDFMGKLEVIAGELGVLDECMEKTEAE